MWDPKPWNPKCYLCCFFIFRLWKINTETIQKRNTENVYCDLIIMIPPWTQRFKTVWSVWFVAGRYLSVLIVRQWNLQKLSENYWKLERMKLRHQWGCCSRKNPRNENDFCNSWEVGINVLWDEPQHVEKSFFNFYYQFNWPICIIIYVTMCKLFTI